MERQHHLDYLRSIALLCVIASHTTSLLYTHLPETKEVYRTLYYNIERCYVVTFAMTVFTVLSGFLFAELQKKKCYDDKTVFLIKKLRRLILPYIFFTTLFAFITRFKIMNFSELLDFITLSLYKGDFEHLWYLTALFWIFIIVFTLIHFLKDRILLWSLILLISFGGALISYHEISFSFLGIQNAIRWFYFFLLGCFLSFFRNKLQKNQSLTSV